MAKKKPIPSCLNVTRSGMEFEHLKKQENSVRQSFKEDCNDIEWAGYMNELQSKDPAGKATRYTFGPLVDSPPAHADTALH